MTIRPARRGRLLAFALAALLAVQCSSGPRLRGRTYGALDAPYLPPNAAAALDREDDPVHRVILIGDAGAPGPDEPIFDDLGRWGDARPDHTTVLFLGDNLYPSGLHDTDRRRGEAILRRQIEATRARKLFIPGNHDWGFSVRDPYQTGTLHNEQEYILDHAAQNADFQPREGCPGPVAISLARPGRGLERGITVIVVDFHWWLLDEEWRPKCAGIDDTEAFLRRFEEQLAAHQGEHVIVAAHHPLRSGGPHGGLTRGFLADLGAGLFYNLYGTLQDLWEPTYAQMINVVSEALSRQPPLAFAAGHEHSLQLLDGGDEARLLIVSGAGSPSQLTRVAAIEQTIFAHSHAGFVVLDFFGTETASDALLVRVVETGKQRPVYTLGIELTPPTPKPLEGVDSSKPTPPRTLTPPKPPPRR